MSNKNYENVYINTVIISKEEGWREIYSSQNYGTFYAVYINFEASIEESSNPLITLKNIQFKIVNYKGILNLGIENAKVFRPVGKNYLEIHVTLQAMNAKRLFKFNEEVSFKKNEIPALEIKRELIPMRGFQPDLSPNDENVLVFDNEYYYRDSTDLPERRPDRHGRSTENGSINIPLASKLENLSMDHLNAAKKNGVRCWQQQFKITYEM